MTYLLSDTETYRMMQIPFLKLFCVCGISGEIKGKVSKRYQQN